MRDQWRSTAVLLLVFVMFAVPAAVFAQGQPLLDEATCSAEQHIQVKIDYEGAWVQLARHQLRLYVPQGWQVGSGEEGALMQAGQPDSPRRLWVEEMEGSGFSLDGILQAFSAMADFRKVQLVSINTLRFVHYTSPDTDVRGFVTLSPANGRVLLFKFEPASDPAFTQQAVQIMSSLTRMKPRAVAATAASTVLVTSWQMLLDAARSGSRQVFVGANLKRGTAEETTVFHHVVTIQSGDGTQYVIDGNGAQAIRIESATAEPLVGTSQVIGLALVNSDAGTENGGALYVEGDLLVKDSLFENNHAERGGALYVQGNVTLEDTVITDNAADEAGGGMYVKDGTATLTQSEITNNQADFGGGIFTYSADVTLVDSTVSGNTATTAGGGIDASLGEVTIDGGTISYNKADGQGGGIASDSTVTLLSGSIANNTAQASGGGIYSGSTAFIDPGDIKLENVTVSGNQASRYGGGVYGTGGSIQVKDTSITNNMSYSNGGGVHQVEGSVKVEDSHITGNYAYIYGGGIYADDATITVTGGSITGNTALIDGGGIYNAFGTTDVSSTYMDDNSVHDTAP